MLIIPAIDLKDGCVVRYVQGKLNKKVYSKDPLKVARHWVSSGAKALHLVDLDGAFTGVPKNISIIEDIIKNIPIPVEVGGGIRQLALVKKLIKVGAWRAVLGTRAAQDKVFLKKAFKQFKGRIIVSIDARAGKVLTKGWRACEDSLDAVSFAASLKKIGFTEVIYTDTSKDGTLSGPNILGVKELLKKTGMRVIASGGISSLDDLSRLKKLENDGVCGVIIGKALYEGRFTLFQALAVASTGRSYTAGCKY